MWLPELLLLAFAPGALIFRAPVLQRDRRAALSAEERAFWAVALSAAFTSVAALALAAASRYTFPRLSGCSTGARPPHPGGPSCSRWR
jgi:hypothetical protein